MDIISCDDLKLSKFTTRNIITEKTGIVTLLNIKLNLLRFDQNKVLRLKVFVRIRIIIVFNLIMIEESS
jgi:hypothetical protein